MSFLFHLKFRTKLILGICGIVIFIALLLAVTIARMASQALIEESKQRGSVLTENLAVRVEQWLLVEDLLQLKNLVDELARLDDVEYAFIQNIHGEVPAHSFSGGFPRQLGRIHPELPEDRAVILLDTGAGLVYDFAAPILIDGQWFGTARVGLSRAGVQQVVNRLLRVVVALSAGALLIALLAGTIFAGQVTRRLNTLRSSAEELVKGRLDQQIGPTLRRNCWELRHCGQTDCPAHGDHRRRCWYLDGTLCPECGPGTFAAKQDSCQECPVFLQNKGDEIQDLAETLDIMALALRSRLEELQAAERVLTRQQHLLSTILEVIPDFVCLLNEKLEYLTVNKAAADFIGLAPTELAGRPAREVAATHEHTLLLAAEGRAVLAAGKARQRELTVLRDGRTYWWHLVGVPVVEKGKNIGVLLAARDITQIKRYQEQLIQAQKMESVGQLAGGVAHEINTPLGIILGYAQLLQEDETPDPEQLSQDLRVIEKQAKACRKIVSDLLGFSRQVQSAKRDICFNNTIMEAAALVRHAFSLDRIEIILDLDDRLPIIYADPEKLKQVWINLFSNARDAMPGGGLILVKVSLDSPRQTITVQVADTGSGMAEHELNKIFDPFYSTKPVGQGTGLGLSVSFGIIEDHGGRIRAFSPPPPDLSPLHAAAARLPEDIVPGKGALFVVELPLDFHAQNDAGAL